MKQAVPLTRDLVLVGGGHAHALVLRKWGMDPMPGVRVTLVNPGPTAPYTGMLPGYVAGHYDRDALEIDLVRLCRFAGARLILDRAEGIDAQARRIMLGKRGVLSYDVASLDIGITAEMDLPGFAAHAVGAKPLAGYAARWRDFLEKVGAGHAPPQVAVIGGGVAGCELAMAMAHALRQSGHEPEVVVIEAGPEISGVGHRARRRLLHAMAVQNVSLRVDAQVVRISEGLVELQQGGPIPAAFCVGAAGAYPHGWIARTGLPQTEGFVEIDRDLRVRGEARLFAVGDCAHMSFALRPKAGVFAVRAAPLLHDNLRAVLRGEVPRRKFRPQKNYLKLISLGDTSALAEKYGQVAAGPLLWRWKDRIDRSFMAQFDNLPQMAPEPMPRLAAAGVKEILAAKPLCGGCGAKVGSGVLSNALRTLTSAREDVIIGAGDDAAVLRLAAGGYQVMSTDHLRAMVLDEAVMARIAAVHALGDVFAMGAAPQVALASIVLPRMSPALQSRALAEITEAAREVFDQVGAQLVGGHTTMGAELTIGFTVTGLRDVPPISVAGAQAGDVLLLTRPIGSGVIMAAEMAAQAPGRVVMDALAQMQQPQDREAQILAAAHAMTDVTGFGLAGHVQAIARASGLEAELWRRKIPVYRGARALAAQGVGSVLLESNRADAPMVGAQDPLLHDPQTAGGLLAALPEADADAALEALKAAGREGWIIGRLTDGDGPIRLS